MGLWQVMHVFALLLALQCSTALLLQQAKHTSRRPMQMMAQPENHHPEADLLVRALKGQTVERTPVWLMRQVSISTDSKISNSLKLMQFYRLVDIWLTFENILKSFLSESVQRHLILPLSCHYSLGDASE